LDFAGVLASLFPCSLFNVSSSIVSLCCMPDVAECGRRRAWALEGLKLRDLWSTSRFSASSNEATNNKSLPMKGESSADQGERQACSQEDEGRVH
jgi:hypothetical protein